MKFGGAPLNDMFYNMATNIGVEPKIASMLYSLIYVGINFIPAYILYRKKIFIKL